MSIFIYFEEQMLFSPSRPPSWNPPPGRRRKIVPLICSYMLNFITTMKALICCGLDSCVWYTSCSVITLPEKRVPRPVSSHTTVCKHPLRWCVLVGVYPGPVREIPSRSLLHLTANLSDWPHMSTCGHEENMQNEKPPPVRPVPWTLTHNLCTTLCNLCLNFIQSMQIKYN